MGTIHSLAVQNNEIVFSGVGSRTNGVEPAVIGFSNGRCCGVDAMTSRAKKYEEYARECVRLAGHADTPHVRDQLLDLARVWMDAAMTEEEADKRKAAAVAHPAA